jgi:hypothetical protein
MNSNVAAASPTYVSSSGEREPTGDPGLEVQRRHPINFEKLHEATDAQLAEAYAAALARAHRAPKLYGDNDAPTGSDAWARFSNEALRVGAEINRRATKVIP